MSWYYNYRGPIDTDEGIKARSKRGDFGETWWSQRWEKALARLMDPGRLSRGRNYARRGQVLSIAEGKDGVAARVQGSRRTPYRVSIRLRHLKDAQWEAVLDALAARASFMAQLLAGEMPADIEEAFAAAGVDLFPEKGYDLFADCSCPDPATVCKHIAATHFILAERFDEDPFLLFRLRGRSEAEIMEALRARRGEALAGEEDEVAEEEASVPLEEQLDGYWKSAQPLNHFSVAVAPPPAPLPLLQRLGQPSFLDEELQRLLRPAYEAMTEAALAAAFADPEM
jgi:uncharacterized Zn finger protein